MRVNFDNAHLLAYGRQYENFASPYAYSWKKTPVFSQLVACISGTPEYILEKLKKMVSEMEGEVGKPIQGTMVTNSGNTTEIITPIWAGEIFKTPEELNPPDPTESGSDGELLAPTLDTEVIVELPLQMVGRLDRVARETTIDENEYIGFIEENGQESN